MAFQYPEDNTTTFWWTRDHRTVIYFLRELTGVGVALYMVGFILGFYFDPGGEFTTETWFHVLSMLGLIAAIFHSITWFAVTLKVTPFDLPKWVERLGFVGLLVLWVVFSYLLMEVFYDNFTKYVFAPAS